MNIAKPFESPCTPRLCRDPQRGELSFNRTTPPNSLCVSLFTSITSELFLRSSDLIHYKGLAVVPKMSISCLQSADYELKSSRDLLIVYLSPAFTMDYKLPGQSRPVIFSPGPPSGLFSGSYTPPTSPRNYRGVDAAAAILRVRLEIGSDERSPSPTFLAPGTVGSCAS
jgi:hypothetical protein